MGVLLAILLTQFSASMPPCVPGFAEETASLAVAGELSPEMSAGERLTVEAETVLFAAAFSR